MSSRIQILALSLTLAALAGLLPSARGAALTWDTTIAANATITAGSGTWLNGSGNWNNGTTSVGINWNNVTSDSATFAGADGGPYIVTVGGNLTNSGLTFANSGYLLSAASAQFITNGSTGLSVAAGKSATISTNVTVTRSASYSLTGGGTLTITNTGATVRTITAGNLTISGNGTTVVVGTGGTLSSAGSILVGSTAGETNSLEVTGGTVDINTTSSVNLILQNGSSGSSTITLTSGSIVNNLIGGSLRFGGSGTASGTFNLNGGTLTVGRIFEAATSVSSTFNFNGGTLKVLATSTSLANFMSGVDTANVRNGGAIIDINGTTSTNGQALVHSTIGGDNATDGGLTITDTAVTKGTMLMTNASTYTGTTTIQAGTLALSNSATLGATTAPLAMSGGRLQLGGLSQTVGAVSITAAAASGETITNGSLTGTSYTANLATGTAIVSANLLGSGVGLTNLGAGTLTLTGTNTYTGTTTVSNGTLNVATRATGGGAYGVRAGGTLGVTLHANGASLAVSSLDLGASGTKLSFNMGALANLTAPVITNSGNLTMAGNVTVDVTWADGYSASTNVLLSYAGSRVGAFSFVAGTLPVDATLMDDTANKRLLLIMPDNFTRLAWQVGDGNWNTSSLNWSNTQTASLTDTFTNGTGVTLDDNATGTSPITITIPADVTPKLLTVNNASKRYVLIGSGAINGTQGLSKSGTNVLVLGGSNSFSGAVTVSAGVVQATNSAALGSTAGATTVASGAAVALSGGVTVAENFSIAGVGPTAAISGSEIAAGSRGALQSSSGSNVISGNITLTSANPRIGCQESAHLNLTGTITTNGLVSGLIFRNGTDTTGSTTIISGTGNAWGDTAIFGGMTRLGVNNGLSTGRLTVGIGSIGSTTFDMNGFSQTVVNLIEAGTNPGITNSGAAPSVLTINNTETNRAFNGYIRGNIAVVKDGAFSQSFGGTNTYAGNTTINAGTLALTSTGSITNSPVITVASGAIFEVNANFALISSQTLRGSGTVSNNAAINGTVAPGLTTGSTIGTLTFSTNVTLAGSAAMSVNSTNGQTADKLASATGTLTYGGTLTVTNLGPFPASGTVFDLFDAPTFAGSFSTTVLPAGGTLHWNTNGLVVDGTITYTNNAPTIGNASVNRGSGVTAKVKKSDLAAFDLDGDAFTYTLGTSTNGATITQDATYLFIPANTVNDAFTVTVSDAFGGTNSATVTVNIVTTTGQTTGNVTLSGGNANLTFYGVPGTTYTVQRSTDLSTWTDITTVVADSNGLVSYVDVGAPTPNAYYRLKF